jgi:hypothetical protein
MVGVKVISGVTVGVSSSSNSGVSSVSSAVGEGVTATSVGVGRSKLSLKGSSQVKYKYHPPAFNRINTSRIMPLFIGECFNDSSISNPIIY